MTGAERPAAVCARCGMVINYVLKLTGRPGEPEFAWVHGGPADHEPVLAPAVESPRLYCDFCSAPDPDWVIGTDRDFQIVTIAPDRGPLMENFTGGWAACDQWAACRRTARLFRHDACPPVCVSRLVGRPACRLARLVVVILSRVGMTDRYLW